jgi:hypothetical protein
MIRWKLPAALLTGGIVASFLESAIGSWGPCGPNPVGLALLPLVLLLPIGALWLIIAGLRIWLARRRLDTFS